MKGKIIAMAAALAVCATISGCTENNSEPAIETTAAASGSEISVTSETTETTSAATVRTTAETEETTVSETSETVQTSAVPKVELSDLKAIYGEKLYSTPECKIIDDFIYENEEDFPAQEHIALARKAVFADEKCVDEINRHNEDAVNEKGFIPVEIADDIAFSEGACYDFDGDGDLESVVVLDLAPTPSWAMGSSAVYYVDGTNIVNVGVGCIPTVNVYALDFGTEKFVQIDVYCSFTSMNSDIYRVGNDTIKPEIKFGETNWIKYLNGVFYCTIKYDFADYPIVFCEDGRFRQLGIKEITEEDFTAHIENGQEFLESLRSEGKIIAGIYTMGYYRYKIDMDKGFICFYINEDGNAVQNSKAYGFLDHIVTEEIDYDIDVSKLDVIPHSK